MASFESRALIKDNFFERQKSDMADIKWRQDRDGKPKLFFYREAYKKLLPFQQELFRETFPKEGRWLELEQKIFEDEQLEEIDKFYADFGKGGENFSYFISKLAEEAKDLKPEQRDYLLAVQSDYLEPRSRKYEKKLEETRKLSKEEESEEEIIEEAEEIKPSKTKKYPLFKKRKKKTEKTPEISKELSPEAIIQIEKGVKKIYGDDYRKIHILVILADFRKLKKKREIII